MISGGAGYQRTFSSQWSIHNDTEGNSASCPIPQHTFGATTPSTTVEDPPHSREMNSHTHSTHSRSLPFPQNSLDRTSRSKLEKSDSMHAASPPVTSPRPGMQPVYATVWETPPQTGGVIAEPNSAQSGTPIGRSVSRSSSNYWRSKFPQERVSPAETNEEEFYPTRTPTAGSTASAEVLGLVEDAGPSFMHGVALAASPSHLDTDASRNPDTQELYTAYSSIVAGRGQNPLITSSTQVDEREGGSSSRVAATLVDCATGERMLFLLQPVCKVLLTTSCDDSTSVALRTRRL